MTAPALSNRLADLAERAGEAARFYKRASVEAHKRYLEAGALLAEARAECRRGEWGGVLKRAGIEARTARNMMLIAAAGYSGESLHAVGGVKAALTLLRDKPTEPAAAEKTETVSVIEAETAPERPTLYQRRKAAGQCVVCGKPADGAARCPACAGRVSERRKARRARTRFGERMAEIAGPRLAAAASAGHGVRLSAAEAAELAAMIASREDAP